MIIKWPFYVTPNFSSCSHLLIGEKENQYILQFTIIHINSKLPVSIFQINKMILLLTKSEIFVCMFV